MMLLLARIAREAQQTETHNAEIKLTSTLLFSVQAVNANVGIFDLTTSRDPCVILASNPSLSCAAANTMGTVLGNGEWRTDVYEQ